MDDRQIVITLRTEGAGANTGNGSGSGQDANAGRASVPSGEDGDKNNFKALGVFTAKQVGAKVLSEGIAWAEYYWNRALALNDDYIGQRDKRVATQQIAAVSGLANGIFNGATTGAMIGGPMGAVIGGVLGFATSVAGLARGNMEAADQQRIAIVQMNEQLNFTRQRAGWSTNAASIGEDL